ncbi:substrate-binding domain-containing protein [Vibrio vulnificus]|uniref:substrate-binding domain-containing protein n=1 Tax=Vibrio vulnificus TaxID=672 RepID=UPI000576C7B0|nr:substrate-binding domain-containing protein [Vibrio vulnificus]EHZ7122329.1 substrate-binding domain-containing protein [Vibrio vulnificus]EKO5191096.1 substrate-binding domain-containing protein [Vibrio vulnificus]ELO5515733.1 substrate-binding domain-containing protein [Vibrio vulnificus]ELV8635567.1 substrate-binding domain-containing protein [Vibrio vulnificus]RZP68939.1 sugar ABC transporter substrate-binding protein [Vibrio vulnificus]
MDMRHLAFCVVLFFSPWLSASQQIVYMVSDLRIPFWQIMWGGIENEAKQLGYESVVLSAENDAKTELENIIKAIALKPNGIILSPTNSSAAVTILKMAEQANIPVVISDIGTEGGTFVSYIESDNFSGAFQLAQILASAMKEKGWQNGEVGVVAIPQKRKNGIERTEGFIEAAKQQGMRIAAIKQQKDFSYQETFIFTQTMLREHRKIRAIWLQGSDRYQAALDAIDSLGQRDKVLLICFDAEPEFIDMIRSQQLVGSGMQQPFLMGERAMNSLHQFLLGHTVAKEQQLEVLAVSSQNLDSLLSTIQRNVLGHEGGSQ